MIELQLCITLSTRLLPQSEWLKNLRTICSAVYLMVLKASQVTCSSIFQLFDRMTIFRNDHCRENKRTKRPTCGHIRIKKEDRTSTLSTRLLPQSEWLKNLRTICSAVYLMVLKASQVTCSSIFQLFDRMTIFRNEPCKKIKERKDPHAAVFVSKRKIELQLCITLSTRLLPQSEWLKNLRTICSAVYLMVLKASQATCSSMFQLFDRMTTFRNEHCRENRRTKKTHMRTYLCQKRR